MPAIPMGAAAGAIDRRRQRRGRSGYFSSSKRGSSRMPRAGSRGRLSPAASESGSDDGGTHPQEDLHPDDVQEAVSILRTTKEHFTEPETGEPSRLAKDLFLEPSQADHADIQKMDAADPLSPEFLGAFGSVGHHVFAVKCQELRDHFWFRTTIIGFIILAGVLVGVQTYPIPNATLAAALKVVDEFVLAVFAAEIVIKVAAEGRFPWKFFYDRWNVFDFIVVLVGYLPFDTQGVTSLRSARLVRVLKLVRALPKLRVLVMGLLSSLTSISYIALLLLLLFYLYAVLGVSVFGTNDPVHFGTLHIALISLFRAATLEDWSDLMYINFYSCKVYGYSEFIHLCTEPSAQPFLAALYFVTFIVLSSMLVLNTFVSVITSSMAEARAALEGEVEATQGKEDITDDDEYLEAKLNELTEVMAHIADEVEAFAQLEKQRKASDMAAALDAESDTDSQSDDDAQGAAEAGGKRQGSPAKSPALLEGWAASRHPAGPPSATKVQPQPGSSADSKSANKRVDVPPMVDDSTTASGKATPKHQGGHEPTPGA